nr:delta(8)-fatty-acid desaturase 1-like [Tanacetum cinerariifolium]
GPPTGNDWFEKQTNGTIDISCSSYMDWFFGGLQFQLEHHLFPRLPRCHLRLVILPTQLLRTCYGKLLTLMVE